VFTFALGCGPRKNPWSCGGAKANGGGRRRRRRRRKGRETAASERRSDSRDR